jgi:hypothetical protein
LAVSPKGKAHGGVDVSPAPRSKDKDGEHNDRTKGERNNAMACAHQNATTAYADHERRTEEFPSCLLPHVFATAKRFKAFVKGVTRSYPWEPSRSGCSSLMHG